MSLEGAIGEEKKLMSQLRGRQTKAESVSRSRSVSANPKVSRATTRSNSAAHSIAEETPYPTSITFQDPSLRLLTEPVKEEDVNVSSEERLTDEEEELAFQDEGRTLPNFAVPEESDTNRTDEIALMNERQMMKKAESAKVADSILASERAISNAKAIGRHVPHQIMDTLEEKAKKAGTEIHVDPEEFYQEKTERKSKLEEYAVYKKRLIQSGSTTNTGFIAPYTRDEENKIDTELAKMLNEKTKLSEVDNDIKHPKSFMLCMDFSEESKYALEWCVGTVLVDSCVLYILNVLEDDDYSSMHLNGIPSSGKESHTQHSTGASRERTRVNNVNEITKMVVDQLKRTKLQVHVVIESCHHPIPRHFIVGIIKHISPTLVVVGSKGSSAIKGVLMGSLSNHLVRKSPAPVMVVRNRLKKMTKKTKFTNNITSLRGLADAKID
ncbi:hypothetical protein JL09_g1258 [Pichia kudriavzevii]|uniref:UspA domain-containing protein n=1 Tax=Pichia kudriavzevii TaxID=4909 RepID=A0A099P3A6_PICKU|nr:hypothetical protein JL09_g1258 [Pichia kudriavzevii]